MDGRLKQIAQLLSDVDTVCFLCDCSGNVIWQNQYAQQSDFDIQISDTIYHVLPQNKSVLEECIRSDPGVVRKVELRYFASYLLADVQGVEGEDHKLYTLWKIFRKKTGLRRYQMKNKDDMIALASEYRNAIFRIYNLLTPMEQLFESAGYYDEMEYLDSIAKNLQKMLRITININEYFQLQNHTSYFVPKTASLNLLLEGLIGQADFMIKDSGKRIVFEAEDSAVFVRIDLNKFTMAFLNILVNALNFSAYESVVSVKLKKMGNNAVISVENEGEGMSREVIQHAFEPFYSYSPQTNQPKGLGLGLYLADEILKAMDGNITVANLKNNKVNVTLRLPLEDAPEGNEMNSPDFIRELTMDKLSLLYVMLSDFCDLKLF